MRLDHLEEQSLRSKKRPSERTTPGSKASKPPKSNSKKANPCANISITLSSSDDSTNGGNSSNDDNFTDRLRVNGITPNSPAQTKGHLRSPLKKQGLKTGASPIKLLTEYHSSIKPTPFDEIKTFKKGVCYKALEQAVLIGEDIREREDKLDGTCFGKLELESDQGSQACRSFLQCLERLFDILLITPVKKDYRLKFSKAYKVLYQSQNDSLLCCFLPEILDSAQEAFPFLWVNGEKYVFSTDVLDHGKNLFKQFSTIRRYIARFTRKL